MGITLREKGSFTSSVGITYSKFASTQLKGVFYYTTNSFTYWIDDITYVDIPCGYLTDGATIPRLFWAWASPIGEYAQGAIVHDFLCETLQVYVEGNAKEVSREYVDKVFRQTLSTLGVNRVTCDSMYRAVSIYRILGRVNKPSKTKEKWDLINSIRNDMKLPPIIF